MNSIWRSLLWKEWREHRWKLAALVVIAVVAPLLMSLGSRDNIFSAVPVTLALAIPLGSMFVGMHAAAGENSQGTIRFLQALPTPLAKPASAKLLWALITVVGPAVAAVLFAAIWNAVVVREVQPGGWLWWMEAVGGVWGVQQWYAATFIAGAAGGVSILLWMSAAGVNRSDEVRAAAIGLLAILACWGGLSAALSYYGQRGPDGWTPPAWYRVVMMAAPGGPAFAQPADSRGWTANFLLPLVVALAMHGALAAWYVTRFGRMAPRRDRVADPTTRTVAPLATALPPPRRSPIAALFWKQLRESAPLAFLGAGLIVLAAIWTAVVSWDVGRIADQVTGVALIGWLMIGAFVAVVAGVGAFMDDLRPGLNTFWRSRPIDVNQWFAVKTVMTAGLTLAILVIPPALLIYIAWDGLDRGWQDNAAQIIPVGLMIQAGLFAFAAAVMTLVRQPIYSAILAIALAIAYWVAIAWVGERTIPHWQPDTHPVATAMLFIIPTATALLTAWLAVRRNWGWKG